MSFGENLRTLIEEQDMTQKELAIQLNIAPSTMGSYVQNTREPDFATLKMCIRDRPHALVNDAITKIMYGRPLHVWTGHHRQSKHLCPVP